MAKKKKELSELDEGIENYSLPNEEPKEEIFPEVGKDDIYPPVADKGNGNGYEPGTERAMPFDVQKLGQQKADLNVIVDKIVNPQGEEKLRLSKTKPSQTRKMVMLDMQQYIKEAIFREENPEYKHQNVLEKLQYSVAKWSIAEGGYGMLNLQKIIANYPQQASEDHGGRTDIYDHP